MKQPLVALVLSLLASAACGGGSSGPTPPTPPAPSGDPIAWAGTALRIMEVHTGPLDSVTTWEISNLTWVTDSDAEVMPLNGERLYKIQSGSVKQTVRQTTGPCVLTGETTFALSAADGSMVVGKAGYSGSVRPRFEETMQVTANCGYGSQTATIPSGELALVINDTGDKTRAKNRLQGTTTFNVATSVHTSTWDFQAIAWQ